jgi:PEP-CTERM motif
MAHSDYCTLAGIIHSQRYPTFTTMQESVVVYKPKKRGDAMIKKMITPFVLLAMLSATAVAAAPIMYVDDSNGRLGTVNVETGAVNLIGSMGTVMTDIAFDPKGHLFGISFSGLYSINPQTAAASFIGNHSISGGNALVFASDGTLYGAGNLTSSLYTINPTTGASTNLGNIGFASGGDLAFNDGRLYLASASNQLVDVNLNSPSETSSVGGFGVSGVFGLATGDDNVLYAVANNTIYVVDTATGLLANPVDFGGSGLSAAFGQSFFSEAVPSIPEPEIYAMLLAGLGLMGVMARRKKKTT